MPDLDDVVRQLYVHTEPMSYRGLFFNTPWATTAANRLHGTKFESPLVELLFEWRLTVSAFQLPYMMTEGLVSFMEGARLFGNAQEESLMRIKLWKEFFGQQSFAMAVAGLMRQSYASLVFSYEHFLLKCYRLSSGDNSTRTSDPSFSKNFSAVFPKTIQFCWSGGEIDRARKVRNAIAHAGAEAGCVPKPKGFKVVDGVLQITPMDVEALMGHLQKAVDRLCAAVTP